MKGGKRKMSQFLVVENVCKNFIREGKHETVLHDISLQLDKGEIISILGESGCGKSTLLNIIGGFEKPSSGVIKLEETRIEAPSRRIIQLFQNYGLLPWRSVLKNVELSLENRKLSHKERTAYAMHYLQLVGLQDRANASIHELSGGMQQRVAIARAFALQPEIILMDEPFAALDTFNRYHLQDELLSIQEQQRTTILLVTHDIDEAIYLSDRIFIMGSHKGTVQKEIHLELSKPRDRSHSDFQYYRKMVFDQFLFHKQKKEVEYYL